MDRDELKGLAWWGCVVGALVCFSGGATVGGCVLLSLLVWFW